MIGNIVMPFFINNFKKIWNHGHQKHFREQQKMDHREAQN